MYNRASSCTPVAYTNSTKRAEQKYKTNAMVQVVLPASALSVHAPRRRVRSDACSSLCLPHITYCEHLATMSVSWVRKHRYWLFIDHDDPRAHHQTLCEPTSCIRCESRACPPNKPIPTVTQPFYLSFKGSAVDFVRSSWSHSSQNFLCSCPLRLSKN